ncbi:multicopper oxidase family protein [Brachybacterium alimentarium]|uniref:Copper oxidase n=1 Tax=Brachybacterium alimentarium TaxID=47845 RepID=A0A2A3YG85_9MICO|nr:multicopper oxidase family protein [Brachybacterium alimentarium]PCC38366.1 copper oxidase [Brachybacterium alimentarium]
MKTYSRRTVFTGGLGAAALTLAACGNRTAPTEAGTFAPPPALTPKAGQNVVTQTLTAAPTTVDLGGKTVSTWAYGESLPGPLIRATAGDLLRITLENRLPEISTIHWHGIRLHNAADGVPGMTQDAVEPEASFTYEFVAPDPGTYFLHSHVGLQLDRGLYAPLIIDDPDEPGDYDAEWIVTLDDWIDDTGQTPDEVLAALTGAGPSDGGGMDHGDMPMGDDGPGGTGHGGMTMGGEPWGDAGDVAYPHFLVNGRVPEAPEIFEAKPRQRVRVRLINASADTIFALALGDHDLSVTHSDGFAVEPVTAKALYLGMGERYDVVVAVKDGMFPLVARPVGKTSGGQALAVLRTGSGSVPAPDVQVRELDGEVLIGSTLEPAETARLEDRAVDTELTLALQGSMQPYRWAINGGPYGQNTPLSIREGQRVRIIASNQTMMTHPLHIHGHTFALPSGLRKDTVLLAAMESFALDFDADNPGRWAAHCHNAYHQEAGMMTGIDYAS